MNGRRPRVVVIGGGFGGLAFCRAWRRTDAEVLLVDRQNHHLFQPLLYQVATAGLSAPEIAHPLRSVFRYKPDIHVRMGEIRDILPDERVVVVDDERIGYDFLVFALGGRTSYFGHPEWEAHAPGLKTLEDAQRIRRDTLLAFERAENTTDEAARRRLMTVAVIGGGPTGVELAGAFAELARHVLRDDFRNIDPARARIVLVEGAGSLLGQFPPDLGAEAAARLRGMGVEVRCGEMVRSIASGRVELVSGEVVEAANIVWAAGVEASPLTARLGAPTDRSGRVRVGPDLAVPGRPEVFVIGDACRSEGPDGRLVPGVSPAAMQAGRHVARTISIALDGGTHRPGFRYWDKGSMATIGRSAAVAKFGDLHLTGLVAWFGWLLIHLVFLIDFRNRVAVLWQWFYAYVTYRRGARIIIGGRHGNGPP